MLIASIRQTLPLPLLSSLEQLIPSMTFNDVLGRVLSHILLSRLIYHAWQNVLRGLLAHMLPLQTRSATTW